MLFYIILCSVLATFFVVNRQGYLLKQSSISLAKIIVTVVIFTVMIYVTTTSLTKEEFIDREQATIKVPKRLFYPEHWKSPTEFSIAEKSDDKCSFDKVLYLFCSNEVVSFTLDSKQDVNSILTACKIPNEHDKSTAIDMLFTNDRFIFGDGVKRENRDAMTIVPYCLSRNGFMYEPVIDAVRLKSLVGEFKYSTRRLYKSRVYHFLGERDLKTFYIVTGSCSSVGFAASIPFSSTEEMIDVEYGKLFSLLNPTGDYYKWRDKNKLFNEQKNRMKQMKSLSYWPISIYTRSFISLIVLVIVVSIGTVFLKNFKLATVVSIVTFVIWLKAYDVRHADSDDALQTNAYALPLSRKNTQRKLSETNLFSGRYDFLQREINDSYCPKLISDENTFTNSSVSPDFNQLSFLDHGDLVDVYLYNKQSCIKYNKGGYSDEFYNRYATTVARIRRDRLKHPQATIYLYDCRLLAFKRISNKSVTGETLEEFLNREFVTFFAELAQEERKGASEHAK